MNVRTQALVVVLAACVHAVGCGGVTSIGDLEGREVTVGGTGIAWIDETVYEFDGEAFALTDRPSDQVGLHLLFTEASFDPTVDLRSLASAERERIGQDIADGDRVDAVVLRGDQVVADDTLTYDNVGAGLPPEVSPFLGDVRVALGRPPLDDGAVYPDELMVLGGKRTAQLHFDETTPRIRGRLDVQIGRTREERSADLDTIDGAFSVLFDVDPIGERLAECNFDPQGAGAGVDPCADL